MNSMVNRGGITFAFRAMEETGATPEQIARAFVVAREIFDLPPETGVGSFEYGWADGDRTNLQRLWVKRRNSNDPILAVCMETEHRLWCDVLCMYDAPDGAIYGSEF